MITQRKFLHIDEDELRYRERKSLERYCGVNQGWLKPLLGQRIPGVFDLLPRLEDMLKAARIIRPVEKVLIRV